jgi:tetratricopeptide (TPR) repeat protein
VNTRRLLGLIVTALFATCSGLQGCTSETPPPPDAPEPAREAFHATKPLRATVRFEQAAEEDETDGGWLQRELRYLLLRGQMNLATNESPAKTFELRIIVSPDQQHATLQLIAPDDVVEREQTVSLGTERFDTMRALATALPSFLDASHAANDWAKFLGTGDARAYDTYLRNAHELFGPSAQGVTRPVASRALTRTIERLEALTRAQPKFARAWAALAIAYLSLGGDDLESLSELAGSAAERALLLDEHLAEAHAALGVVSLRENEWIAAQDRFARALAMDANLASAAEGLACLYVDSGHPRRSLPYAQRAVALQPRNVGANECLTYASIESASENATDFVPIAPVARVHALGAFLQGDTRAAERLLRRTIPRAEFEIWAGPTLQAASNRRLVPEALKAITLAANDGYIDAATEILCGAALKQPEFVFNRLARLAREETHAPLRVLWLPKADFLRNHSRFEQTISTAGLTSLWHSIGPPDICDSEPNVYGCNLRGESLATRE